jgi:hypothetical protein
MRFLVLALGLLVSACTPGGASLRGAGCNLVAERTAAFTGPGVRDAIEARAIGRDCAGAVVVWTVRNAAGKPLFAHAAPYEWIHKPVDPTSAAEMQAFLDGWANAPVDDTSASPEWKAEDLAAAEAWGPGGASMFVRETYESIRAAKLPRICLPTSSDAYQCIFYDAEAEAVDVHFSGGA